MTREEYDEAVRHHVEEYNKQLATAARQLARDERLLTSRETQAERFGAILDRWEEQTKRFDAILDHLERTLAPPESGGNGGTPDSS